MANDHVHLFLNTSTDEAPYQIAKWVKGRASHHLKKEFPELKKLPALWTPTYFLASTGQVNTDTLKSILKINEGNKRYSGLKPVDSDFILFLKERGSHPPAFI